MRLGSLRFGVVDIVLGLLLFFDCLYVKLVGHTSEFYLYLR
jgi:hypothetical protein